MCFELLLFEFDTYYGNINMVTSFHVIERSLMIPTSYLDLDPE